MLKHFRILAVLTTAGVVVAVVIVEFGSLSLRAAIKFSFLVFTCSWIQPIPISIATIFTSMAHEESERGQLTPSN